MKFLETLDKAGRGEIPLNERLIEAIKKHKKIINKGDNSE